MHNFIDRRGEHIFLCLFPKQFSQIEVHPSGPPFAPITSEFTAIPEMAILEMSDFFYLLFCEFFSHTTPLGLGSRLYCQDRCRNYTIQEYVLAIQKAKENIPNVSSPELPRRYPSLQKSNCSTKKLRRSFNHKIVSVVTPNSLVLTANARNNPKHVRIQ